MAAKSTRKQKRLSPEQLRELVLDSALRLAGTRPWNAITLADLARECKISLADLYSSFPTKIDVCRALIARTDQRVLAAADEASEDDSARDRLFDLIMQRFDVLAEHRDGVVSIARGIGCDPLAVLCISPTVMRSMNWTLEAAGISTSGPCGAMRVKGLAAVYAATFRVWARDDSQDMARTMAALDKALANAEKLAKLCLPGRRRQEQQSEMDDTTASAGAI